MLARRLTVLFVVAATALAGAAVAGAFTSSAAGGSMAVSSATLASPTGAAVTQPSCHNNAPVQLTVTWTASGSSWATGYRIRRATASGGPFTTVGTVAVGTTSYVDADPALAYSTTYYYEVDATYQSWTATSGQASVTSLSKLCK